MKKLFLLGMAALMSAALMAQNDNSQDMTKMMQQHAEQVAKSIDLKGDAKTEFEHLYMQYTTELMGSFGRRQNRQPGEERAERQGKKKEEMTTEEANQRLQDIIEQQERQAADAQRRVEVTKKYIAEFSKTLTPQQVVKVMQGGGQMRQRQGMPGGPRMGGMGGMRGEF